MTQVSYKYGFPLFTLEKPPIHFSSNILSTDIWSFWDYTIKKRFTTLVERNIPQALLSQARTFYLAAENADVHSKPLLYYYSFLNYAKMGIYFHRKFDKSQRFDHGIESLNGSHKSFAKDKVKITKRNSGTPNPNKRSTCYEVLELVEDDFCFIDGRPISIGVKNLLSHCVGTHKAYCNVYSEKEFFYKLHDCELCKDGKKAIFTGQLDGLPSTELEDLSEIYGTGVVDPSGEFKIETSTKNYGLNRSDYLRLSKKIRELGIWYLIGTNGYELYISRNPFYRYSPEFVIYAIMFYLGSITRYHPYLFEDIFSDKDQWVVSEFLATQPKQFLYLFTSKVFGVEILEPKSKF